MLIEDFKKCIKHSKIVTYQGAQIRFSPYAENKEILMRWTGIKTNKEFYAIIDQKCLDSARKVSDNAIETIVSFKNEKSERVYSEILFKLEFWNMIEMPVNK